MSGGDIPRGTFLPRAEWQPGDVDLLALVRDVKNELARGIPGCELVDQIADIAELARRHPNPEARALARQLLAAIT